VGLCYAVGNSSEDELNKRRLALAVFLFLFGTLPLMNSFKNPRLSGIHGTDRLQLIAAGWCFGVGFGVLMGGRGSGGE
jgi:hypothetical protein